MLAAIYEPRNDMKGRRDTDRAYGECTGRGSEVCVGSVNMDSENEWEEQNRS